MALSRDEVVTGALTLLDKVGLDALTMRRLAQSLGVQAGAIYWHFKNKQELVDAMADAIMGEFPLPDATASWDQRLGELARHMMTALMKRRDSARLTSQALRPGPNSLGYVEAMLRIISESGKSHELVLWTAAVIGYYIIGFVTDMQAQANAVRQKDLEKLIRDFTKELDPVAYPEMAKFTPRQYAEMMKAGPARARFEFGLEVLLRGLTSDAATRPPATGTKATSAKATGAKAAAATKPTRARRPHRRR